jgi:hypothetical protein
MHPPAHVDAWRGHTVRTASQARLRTIDRSAT